jgi:cytochrome c oxidase subunit II
MRRNTPRTRGALVALALVFGELAAGCESAPSPFDPRAEATARIAELGWLLVVLATAACIVVFASLAAALLLARRRGTEQVHALAAPPFGSAHEGARRDDWSRVVIVGGMVAPAVVIAFTLGYTIYTLREVAGVGGPGGANAFGPHTEHGPLGERQNTAQAGAVAGEPALTVQVVGRQWWWQVRYANELFVTANEIHIPTGVPVRIAVTSEDVIHSFWVPQITGKVDVIPGKTNSITIRADHPGVYRGMCSEFCGLQHAHMHLHLHVEPPQDFSRWLDGQRRVPLPPSESLVQRGQQVFSRARCAECHTVRGSFAGGTSGPDLTHVASRRTLGAGINENTPANLAEWTVNAQAIKPGNKMPSIPLAPEERDALVAYLETLE